MGIKMFVVELVLGVVAELFRSSFAVELSEVQRRIRKPQYFLKTCQWPIRIRPPPLLLAV
jgi:hypothetical protein